MTNFKEAHISVQSHAKKAIAYTFCRIVADESSLLICYCVTPSESRKIAIDLPPARPPDRPNVSINIGCPAHFSSMIYSTVFRLEYLQKKATNKKSQLGGMLN